MGTDIINQLINQYTGSITNLQTGSIAIGKELFNAIALISIAVLGFNYLLRKNTDLSDANIELIKWLIYLDFFYAFITNFPSIYTFIYSSIQQIGNYLGSQAAGKAINLSPSNILGIGVKISWGILCSNISFNLFKNILYPLVSVVSAGVILFCFTTIGLELILVQIGSQIILVGGVFLLAFSGFQWTRDYAERYVHTFFHIGIKMIFVYILVGLGIGLAESWSQIFVNSSWQIIIEHDIATALASYIYYKLCLKLPDQAVSWLTGRLAIGFDTATDVKAAAKTASKAVTTVATGGAALALEAQGMAKASGLASQIAKSNLEAQGKKETAWNVGLETIKTLGEARKKLKQEIWDKKIDDTVGGKLAKSILDSTPEKDTKESLEDYSI